MRKLIFLILFSLVATAGFAQVAVVPTDWGVFVGTDPFGRTLDGKGYARYAVAAVVIDLADAPTAGSAIDRLVKHAIITAEDGAVRVRFDGTDPTAAEGMLIASGQTLTLTGQRSRLLALRMIATAGTVKVTVTYGR